MSEKDLIVDAAIRYTHALLYLRSKRRSEGDYEKTLLEDLFAQCLWRVGGGEMSPRIRSYVMFALGACDARPRSPKIPRNYLFAQALAMDDLLKAIDRGWMRWGEGVPWGESRWAEGRRWVEVTEAGAKEAGKAALAAFRKWRKK